MSDALRIGFYVLYGALAVAIAARLVSRWKAVSDRRFDLADRRLVGASVFYLAVPFAVLLHEGGHVAAVLALGGRVTGIDYMVLWGDVSYEGRLDWLAQWLIALSGNAVSVALGAGAIVWTLKRPGRAAWNYARLEMGRIQLLLALVLYPLFCLVGFPGDWTRLYSPRVWPLALPLLLLHLGALAWAVRGWRGTWLPRRVPPAGGPWKQRYNLLASPVRDAIEAARARLTAHPDDREAWLQLGSAYLAAGASADAIEPLRRAADGRPDDARSSFLLGLAELDRGHLPAAIETLCAAGRAAEAMPSLSHEIVLWLATARLRAGQVHEAMEAATIAREERADDARAFLLWCDAAIAVGRRGDAATELERALPSAEGPLAVAIRSRLESLSKPR